MAKVLALKLFYIFKMFYNFLLELVHFYLLVRNFKYFKNSKFTCYRDNSILVMQAVCETNRSIITNLSIKIILFE